MPSTSNNFEGVQPCLAPAGGVTAYTPSYNATSKMLTLPMTTATSGNTYSGKVTGLVKGMAKFTGVAWVHGQALRWITSLNLWKITTINTHVSQGSASTAATAAATTGDVILRFPCAGVI